MEEHRPIAAILKDLAEAINHIENNRSLTYRDLTEGDGYEALEYLKNMTVWIQDARRHHLTLSREAQEVASVEAIPPPGLLLPPQIDLACLLRCLIETAETGYVTPGRVADYVEWDEALTEEATHAHEQRLLDALNSLCALPILIRRSDIEAVYCPQCQRCNILTLAGRAGSLEEQIECVYCTGKRALRFWKRMPCFSFLPTRTKDLSTSQDQLAQTTSTEPGATIGALLHALDEEHQIDQAMRWSFHQQGAMPPANFPPDLVLSFLLAYAEDLLKRGNELSQPRLGNVYFEDEAEARYNAQQAAALYRIAYLLAAKGINAAEGQTWTFQR